MSARFFALASAVLFSTGGAAIKGTTLNHWQVAGMRSCIAALAIACILPGARRIGNWRVWLVGVAYALTLVLFVAATKFTTAANAIFLQGSAPLYLLLLGPFFLREKVRAREVAILLVVACGMTLVFLSENTVGRLAPHPVLGNWLGAITGLTWALIVTGLRWMKTHGADAMAPVLAGNLLAVALCLPFLFPFPAPSVHDAAALLYLGLIQIALAYWCLTKAVAGLSALETALLVMLEPALNPFWTWLLHGERPADQALAGGALILLATGAQAVLRR